MATRIQSQATGFDLKHKRSMESLGQSTTRPRDEDEAKNDGDAANAASNWEDDGDGDSPMGRS